MGAMQLTLYYMFCFYDLLHACVLHLKVINSRTVKYSLFIPCSTSDGVGETAGLLQEFSDDLFSVCFQNIFLHLPVITQHIQCAKSN